MEHCRIEMVPLLALSNLSASGRQDFVSICSVKWLPYTATKKNTFGEGPKGHNPPLFSLNSSILLPMTAPSKHLHQHCSKC